MGPLVAKINQLRPPLKLMSSWKGNSFLPIKLQEISLTVLLVCGSIISSFHPDLWERLLQGHRLELKGTSVSLKMVNDSASVVLIVGVRFGMEMEGGIEVTPEFLVAAIEYSMIIEIDLLKNFQGVLDVGHYALWLRDKLIQCVAIIRKSNGGVRLCINYHGQNSLLREATKCE